VINDPKAYAHTLILIKPVRSAIYLKMDMATMSKLYHSDTDDDKTVDVNANVGREKSPNNYQSEIFKGLTKLNGLYLLWNQLNNDYGKKIARECLDNLITGDLYFHDLSGAGVSIPYCFAWASNNVFNGRSYGQLYSKPPKRSDSFIACVVESIFDLSTQLQGAISIPDFFVNLAYFYKKEGLLKKDDSYKHDAKKIKNDFQRIVHSLNQQYRVSNQSAFTNFSIMDRPTMKTTFEDYNYCDGNGVDIEYVQKIQEIYVEFMSTKDPTTNLPYRFPINTLNIHTSKNNEIMDTEFLKMACKHNTEGIFNVYITKGQARLMQCCRMQSDPVKLREYSRFDSFANAGISLGSARVVTLNFARIGKKATDEKEYFEILNRKLEKTRKLLKSQRNIMNKRIKEGFLKFFTLGWMHESRFFSTFGMNGLYESLLFMGIDIRSKEGINMCKKIFKTVEKALEKFSKEDKIAFNFEQIPAEGAASLLAKMDKLYFNDDAYPYQLYGNQFIPLWIDCDLMERAHIDGQLCEHMSGGSICHLNIGSKVSPKQMETLIDFAVKCQLEHFALNGCFNICEDGHSSIGKPGEKKCLQCGKKIVDSLTRVVGYYTNTSSWDKTRREFDYPLRVFNEFKEYSKDIKKEVEKSENKLAVS